MDMLMVYVDTILFGLELGLQHLFIVRHMYS